MLWLYFFVPATPGAAKFLTRFRESVTVTRQNSIIV